VSLRHAGRVCGDEKEEISPQPDWRTKKALAGHSAIAFPARNDPYVLRLTIE
jgi:hypothetical protein